MHRIALLVALTAFASAATAQYEIRRTPGAQSLSISLRLPSGAREPVKLAPRGTAWGLRPQVSDVRCDKKPLQKDVDGNWSAPASCGVVTWQVVPDRVPAEGADASGQRTLDVGKERWLLLAEPTSLLRPHNIAEAGTIRAAKGSWRLAGATPVQPDAFRVPPINSAPEFYVLGKVEPSRRTVGRLEVSYVADDTDRVKQLDLEALHASALAYLLQVVALPPAATVADRSLLVVWLGVAESSGEAGGAAGSRSFVANYIAGSPENRDRNTALSMMIIGHEQFHQLVDMVRSDLSLLPFATWLNESLAHYYGLKALLAADKSAAAGELWAKFIDLQRPVEQGLLELNRRHESGEQAVYNSFYSQGATLWHALDRAIATATDGQKKLDDYIGDLLRAPVGADGSLPSSITDQLRRVGGANVDQVLSKYVGQ